MFFSSAFAALPPRSKLKLFALTAPITNSYCVATLFWYFLAQYVNKNCPFHLSAVIVHTSPNSYSSNYNATFSFLQKAVNRYWPIIYNYHMQDFASNCAFLAIPGKPEYMTTYFWNQVQLTATVIVPGETDWPSPRTGFCKWMATKLTRFPLSDVVTIARNLLSIIRQFDKVSQHCVNQ